jgi:hypothetical protein
MCNEYNGWTNRETWATALWLDNDRGLYYTVQEMAQEAILSKDEDQEYACSTCLAENLEALFDEAFSDLDEMTQEGLNMLKDIGSLYRVNWYEIAGNILSELQTQQEASA